MNADPYVYSGTTVLKNKLGLTDPATLAAFERRMVAQRAAEGIPSGNFDLAHLRAIHRHLFQDVYEWAGEVRTTELAKGSRQFMFQRFIERGVADVAKRIAVAAPYSGWPQSAFADEAGRLIGDINYVHPFREGNGRTQLQFLKQLAEFAGWLLDLREIEPAK